MGRYKYNDLYGPKLPEWDKDAYPYAMMYQSLWDDETEPFYSSLTPAVGLTLLVTDKLGYLDFPRLPDDTYQAWNTIGVYDKPEYVYTLGGNDGGSDLTQEYPGNPNPILYIRFIIDGNGQWQLFDSGELSQIYAGEYYAYPAKFAWTNFDAYNKAGELILAASEPVLLFDLKSWLTGFALGLSGKPLPLSTGKKLVGYSYNGTVLPALPEWDKTVYPYAIMVKPLAGGGGRYLFATKNQLSISSGTETSKTIFPAMGDMYCIASGTAWGEWKTNSSMLYNVYNDWGWANYDVLNEDGNLYLAASEPVPVYE